MCSFGADGVGSRKPVATLCPECLDPVRGRLEDGRNGDVYLAKTCRTHGDFRAVVAHTRDALTDAYDVLGHHPRKVTQPTSPLVPVVSGCPDDCGLCTGHGQHTCLAVIEITSRCPLECPVCLAAADHKGRDLELGVVESALRCAIGNGGSTPALQISGGEPSLHPQLMSIIERAQNLGFEKIELDTNGLLLGESDDLATDLKKAGLSGIYLQFDSLRVESIERIRGRNILANKLAALERCQAVGLSVVLSVTVVPGINDDELWSLIRFAASRGLAGIDFQAMAHSGRFPPQWNGQPERFTHWQFRSEVERQSEGRLLASDFAPMSCSDPRCGALSYLLVRDKEFIPLRCLLPEDQLRELVADFCDWATALRMLRTSAVGAGLPRDSGCGCESGCGTSPRDLSLERLVGGSKFFSVGFHGLMDAYTVDLERVRRCCVHQVTPQGQLVPLCLFNMKYRPQQSH